MRLHGLIQRLTPDYPQPTPLTAFDNIEILERVPSISTWPEVEDAFKRAFYIEIDIPGAIEVSTFRSRDAFHRA